jgi:hypothetical protein
VRLVPILSIAGGILSLAGVVFFIPRLGLAGAAVGRLFYGPVAALDFLKIKTQFARTALPPKEPVLPWK